LSAEKENNNKRAERGQAAIYEDYYREAITGFGTREREAYARRQQL